MLSFLGPIGLVQKIVGAVALSAILALSLALFMADRRADKWERQAVKCNATLDRLADESAARQKETARRVEEAKERIVVVEREAKRVEEAVLPGQCATPGAVLQADL